MKIELNLDDFTLWELEELVVYFDNIGKEDIPIQIDKYIKQFSR